MTIYHFRGCYEEQNNIQGQNNIQLCRGSRSARSIETTILAGRAKYRAGLEYILTNRTYDEGIRDCCQWLRKTTIIEGKDLPDGRTFNEFVCDEMSSALKATSSSEKEDSQEPS